MFDLDYTTCGVTIRSENAAKPYTMPSVYLSEYIKGMKGMGDALDFGCGKLRYSNVLVGKFNAVTFLDSEKQLNRLQMVRGVKTTVSDYININYVGCNSISFEKINDIDKKYDFILCSNVLSAIPCKSTIDSVISSFALLLKSNGRALIVNQYKSSYFKRYEGGVKHLYGYVYKNSKSASYYGILDEKSVRQLCLDNGLAIINSWSREGSSYVEVGVKGTD
jgi:2-polyprenyl-3-methyl-5-hydroxy-6-metoxy-1,4-benzoquinol methylase